MSGASVSNPYRSQEVNAVSPPIDAHRPTVVWTGTISVHGKPRNLRVVRAYCQVGESIIELLVYEQDTGPDRLGNPSWSDLPECYFRAALDAITAYLFRSDR